jgi:hypothetical protein
MEIYVLKSALCLAIFFVFYKAFLESTSVHHFKRFYLLASVLISLGIPFITFTTYVETPVVSTISNISILETGTVVEDRLNYSAIVLWTIYGLGVIYFGLKFIGNLRSMIWKIRSNPKRRSHRIINVLLSEKVVPHTFFNYIFFNKERFENHEIPAEVIEHEETHAREKHSLDILIIELCRVVFWFNPLFYYIRHSVKLNHEFLADRSVLKSGADTGAYQKTLLAYSSNASSPQLANSINYSFIKKRFTVMKTKTSKRGIWIRSFLILPLLAIALYSFSSRELVPVEEKVISENISIQQSATREEMKEYTELAKKYNAMPKEERIVKLKDLKRLEYIYNKMSPKQKANAEPFPECIPPPPPPAPDAPDRPDAPKEVRVMKGVNDTDVNIPPPPGPPPYISEDPIDHINRMAGENAAFLYENKRITSDEAIALLKANSDLNIETQFFDKSNPIVKISKKGFTRNKNTDQNNSPSPAPVAFNFDAAVKQGSVFYLDGKKIDEAKFRELSKEPLKIKTVNVVGQDDGKRAIYMNTFGIEVVKSYNSSLDLILDLAEKDGTFYYNENKISSAKAISLLKEQPNLIVKSQTGYEDGKEFSKVWITDKK